MQNTGEQEAPLKQLLEQPHAKEYLQRVRAIPACNAGERNLSVLVPSGREVPIARLFLSNSLDLAPGDFLLHPEWEADGLLPIACDFRGNRFLLECSSGRIIYICNEVGFGEELVAENVTEFFGKLILK